MADVLFVLAIIALCAVVMALGILVNSFCRQEDHPKQGDKDQDATDGRV